MKAHLYALPVLAALAAGPAIAQSGAEIGTLTCKVVDISNVVVYTKQTFACDFKHTNGEVDNYTGQIKKVGVDLSVKTDFTLIWGVLSPTDNKYEMRSLTGTYVGTGADVAVVGGVGAKVLIGGGSNSFTLQPISVAGVVGGGASVGIERFTLE